MPFFFFKRVYHILHSGVLQCMTYFNPVSFCRWHYWNCWSSLPNDTWQAKGRKKKQIKASQHLILTLPSLGKIRPLSRLSCSADFFYKTFCGLLFATLLILGKIQNTRDVSRNLLSSTAGEGSTVHPGQEAVLVAQLQPQIPKSMASSSNYWWRNIKLCLSFQTECKHSQHWPISSG